MNRKQAVNFLNENGAFPNGATPLQKGAMVDGVLAYATSQDNAKGNSEYDQFFQAGWMEAQQNFDG